MIYTNRVSLICLSHRVLQSCVAGWGQVVKGFSASAWTMKQNGKQTSMSYSKSFLDSASSVELSLASCWGKRADPRSNIIIRCVEESPCYQCWQKCFLWPIFHFNTVTNIALGLEILVYLMGRNMYSGFTDFLGTILRSEVTHAIDCKLTVLGSNFTL